MNTRQQIALGLIVVCFTAILLMLFKDNLWIPALISLVVLTVYAQRKGWFGKIAESLEQHKARLRKFRPRTNLVGEETLVDENEEFERVGIYFNVFEWNFFARPILSLLAGLFMSLILLLSDSFLELDIIDGQIFFGIVACMTLFFAQADETDLRVPAAHAAMLTLWGMRFRLYLKEGDYSWSGQSLGFGRSNAVRTEGTDDNGFINIEPFPINIWNKSDERGKLQLESHAKNSSKVFTTLTVIMVITDPMLWINSNDPALDFSDKARDALRTAIGYFTDIDCAVIKNIFWKMMIGESVLTTFLPRDIIDYAKWSIIRSNGGTPLYTTFPSDADSAEVEKITNDFLILLNEQADPKMLEACSKDGKVKLEIKTIESIFSDVYLRLGVVLKSASVGIIELSDVVTTEANKAASEGFQRSAQTASANATAEGVRILDQATKGVSDLVTGIIASKDYDGVKVVVTGGGNNKLKDAAATHAVLSNKEE